MRPDQDNDVDDGGGGDYDDDDVDENVEQSRDGKSQLSLLFLWRGQFPCGHLRTDCLQIKRPSKWFSPNGLTIFTVSVAHPRKHLFC